MKRSYSIRMLTALPVIAIAVLVSSFSRMPGGEGFEVYKNNTLLLQQFGNNMKSIQTLSLENILPADKLTIKYYHCGKAGKNRHIIVRSGNNIALKNWQYANMATKDDGMSFHPAELLNTKNKINKVNIYYTSEEMPKEKLLVMLQFKS
jgi:hypothetical protein